jgi:hypothetical protein
MSSITRHAEPVEGRRARASFDAFAEIDAAVLPVTAKRFP